MVSVVRQFSLSRQQHDWIKSQVQSGKFENESDVVSELIRERLIQDQESQEYIAAVRRKLVEGEESGFVSDSPSQIWEYARNPEGSR